MVDNSPARSDADAPRRASLSLRENERGSQIAGNWDPTHHQPTDVLTTFDDKDYMIGLTSAQTTLGALGRLVGAAVRK